jgi:UDP-N-acetylmuramoyl-L-alanyl-D-glutamate--2,6-diaminopimelate ligase
MEVSSHSLAQARCVGHPFACGVFTNLSGDHLDYHQTSEAYANAKKRLFDHLDRQARAVVNSDDPMSSYMLKDCRAPGTRFGLNAKADVTASICQEGIDGSRLILQLPFESCEIRLSLPGRHSISNALAAAATAQALGIDTEHIRRGLERIESVPGRLQRVSSTDGEFAVFVDYAHTDDALVNVLAALRPLTRGRLICVFGCGGDRDRTKRPRMAKAVAEGADRAIVTSDNPRSEDPLSIINDICAGFTPAQRRRVEIQPDRKTAIERSIALAEKGDTILIAGKGHENYQIIGDTRRHFDDVEVACDCLRATGQSQL